MPSFYIFKMCYNFNMVLINKMLSKYYKIKQTGNISDCNSVVQNVYKNVK